MMMVSKFRDFSLALILSLIPYVAVFWSRRESVRTRLVLLERERRIVVIGVRKSIDPCDAVR
jgi:hypothetical protein